MQIMKWLCLINTLLFFSALAAIADPLSAYNVLWNSPSEDFNGSMPIGNGDIGMNVWVEKNGDLILLLSKTDSWSENSCLLKLGKVHLALSPNPFIDGNPFEQTLCLRNGEIMIKAGLGNESVSIRIWVDANRPVIHVEAESLSSFTMTAALEVWRNQQRQLKDKELNRVYGLQNAPFPVYAYPDTVCENQDNQIVWYHRNQHSIWKNNLEHQGMEGFIEDASDPLMELTYGGCIKGSGLKSETPVRLSSTQPRKIYEVSIFPLCAQSDTVEQWLNQLHENVAEYSVNNLKDDLAEHRTWWDEFWNRSWIYAYGSEDAEVVTRGYVLQRWINACAGRGKYAIKFNGSIFTVKGDGFDADYRRWGGPYWWQNTRLPYWPMLACGDFDLMRPLFNMYQEMMPLAQYRTKVWFGHCGAFIGETVYFWGMYTNENYGWIRNAHQPVSEINNRYIRREYTASLELIAMMIDYYQYTQDIAFLNETLLPMSDSLLEFWDNHYGIDDNGTMLMYPAQALETLQDAENPSTDIAGLKWVLSQLISINEKKISTARRNFFENLLAKVPPLPIADTDDGKVILGAEKVYGNRGNSENPELYTVFPFRLYGIGKPEIELGRKTFEQRTVKDNKGWRQDETQAAYLGFTQVSKEYLVERAKTKHSKSRFPAFWGPNFDWIPDQDHGGNLMKAFQTMLLQADDGKIYLRPAWPDSWNVDFKLHAPLQTIIEGKIKEGKVVSLELTPPSRRKDVIIINEN